MMYRHVLRLPKLFIFLAFINFVVGSTLGGLMATNLSWWPVLASIHGEINPFGWLTMLIYGMTYVVLFLSLGLRLPRRWQGRIHVVSAEAAVVLIVLSIVFHEPTIYRLGLILQTLTPFLFLANIFSMIIVRRRHRKSSLATDGGPEVTVTAKDAPQAPRSVPSIPSPLSTPSIPSTRTDPTGAGARHAGEKGSSQPDPEGIIGLFGVVDHLKDTDGVAQRGTDLSLMVLLVAVVWILSVQLFRPITWPFATPSVPTLLVYYGWIAGTVLSVAMHLYPRLLNAKSITGTYAQIGQVLWAIAVLCLLSGAFWPPLLEMGGRIMGVAFAWQALGYLGTMQLRETLKAAGNLGHRLNIALWAVAWSFALILGIVLLLGLAPDALAALHLLFLGWITILVYSIGYRVFPLLLNRRMPPRAIVWVQTVTAFAGAVFMPLGFWGLQHGIRGAMFVLAWGGILAVTGALIFLLQWLVKMDW